MARLAVVVILFCAIYFGSLKFANAACEEKDLEQNAELESQVADERSGFAIARARVKIARIQNPSLVSPPVLLPPLPAYSPTVECFVCTDCPAVLANTTTKICPARWHGDKDQSCVSYSEKYNHLKRPWYIRGCAAERGSCEEIVQAHSEHSDVVRLLSCNECQGDLCNTSGAPRSLSDITMAFVVLVITPLVAKYTVS